MSAINKRTVLVSGASSGIGKAIAERLLTAGHQVIGISRDVTQFSVKHAGFNAVCMDFSQPASIPQLAKQLLCNYPQLDAAVFAAGYGQFSHLEQFSYAQIERLLTVNLTAQIFLTRALLPAFKRLTHSNLIYIGSEAGLKGSRNGTVYCASKFALRGFTQALRDECAKSGVKVSIINPGMVDTAFFDALNFTPGKQPAQALQAEDVSDAVDYILHAGRYCIVDEININPVNKVIEFKK
jgi:3-hydroxy acid dehydrogenase / malonic semialdehyde reductase